MAVTATAVATMILFAGQNLDGWITIAGQWGVVDGAMTCQSAPASIRSSYESDDFVLRFRYRRAAPGTNYVAAHSKMTTGGTQLLLTPIGALLPGMKEGPASAVQPDEWIDVRVEVATGHLRAVSTRASGEKLNDGSAAINAGSRGFLRFGATEPGLEIRNIIVAEPGFKPMFDKETLDGWDIARPKYPDDPGWVNENGVVRCRPRRSGWLRTLRTYDNFVLRLEYQLPPRGNSGIYLRAPIEGRVSRNGLEIQLLDDVPNRGRIKPVQHTGSIYDGIAPEVQVPTPVNQWNAIEVHLNGKQIRTTLNGIQLYDARLTDSEKDTNSHRRPLATRRAIGFIGLQDHSAAVKFRNARIRELP